MKARHEHQTTIGWQVERFAREGKRMSSRTLDDYLKPAAPVAASEQGARAAKRMFDRLIKKQESGDGDR